MHNYFEVWFGNETKENILLTALKDTFLIRLTKESAKQFQNLKKLEQTLFEFVATANKANYQPKFLEDSGS
jgi:hypothetical protein